jgi:hypothetical protein
MNTKSKREIFLEHIVATLEIPESAYERAAKRGFDLGTWLGRKDSICYHYSPHVFPQGSFRLGTVIRPLNDKEEYDLDLACSLREGVTKQNHSQKELKSLVGSEIQSYRNFRNISEPVTEKHRCWRLEYLDDLSFHMDIVPCIPTNQEDRVIINNRMITAGRPLDFANRISAQSVSITDNRLDNFDQIDPNWQISNPEGYAQWFESKMLQNQTYMTMRAESKVDKVPIYKTKNPLQRVIQILKRHRDQMFRNNIDSKPISIIITTLAANSYQGNNSLTDTLRSVISGIQDFSNSNSNLLPNPVDPKENFADRWTMPQYNHLNLKDNFKKWSEQVSSDASHLLNSNDVYILHRKLSNNLNIFSSESSLMTSKDLGML